MENFTWNFAKSEMLPKLYKIMKKFYKRAKNNLIILRKKSII